MKNKRNDMKSIMCIVLLVMFVVSNFVAALPVRASVSENDVKESTSRGPLTGQKVGTLISHKKSNGSYKITSMVSKTVTYMKPLNEKKTNYNIPASITYEGVTYKVTAINNKAFSNNKKIKKVTIGKNVTKIGAKAFYKCINLKNIVMKSSKLKKNAVGKKAITGIYEKAAIKVPKKKLKAYKKVFTSKTGYKKSMKIKK